MHTGLSLPQACALIQRESGGLNIFGCSTEPKDPNRDEPPYCHHEVTRERVERLMESGVRNDIGLPQLSWSGFIDEAEELGGVEEPLNQCRVAFKFLKTLIDKYGWSRRLEAWASYNAGEGGRFDRIEGYAIPFDAYRAMWKELLEEVEEDNEEE